MSAFSEYAAASEHTAMVLPNERVEMLNTYVRMVQNDGADGLPVSADALAMMQRGTRTQQYRRRLRTRLHDNGGAR